MPLNTVLNFRLEDVVAPSILLIPNLFVSSTGKNLPDWKVQSIYDLLLARAVQSKPSVVYVEELGAVGTVYGKPFADHLSGYKVVV
jgi:hypothetical protein